MQKIERLIEQDQLSITILGIMKLVGQIRGVMEDPTFSEKINIHLVERSFYTIVQVVLYQSAPIFFH